VLPSEHVVAMLILWQHYHAHGKEIANPTMIPMSCQWIWYGCIETIKFSISVSL